MPGRADDAGAVRIVVADGHPLYRRGLAALLAAHPGWTVVAQEDSGLGAVSAAARTSPDVVVMDLDVAHLDAAEATRRIVAADPGVRVLVLARDDDADPVFSVVRAGAWGHLRKDAEQAQVVGAVAAVARGEALLGPSVARRVLEFVAEPPRPGGRSPEFTGREYEVLNLIATGWTSADIAKVLVLGHEATRDHVAGIVAKLHGAR